MSEELNICKKCGKKVKKIGNYYSDLCSECTLYNNENIIKTNNNHSSFMSYMNFDVFTTIEFIKIIHWILCIILVITMISMVIYSIYENTFRYALGSIIGIPILYLFMRIMLEFIIVIFKINENIKKK